MASSRPKQPVAKGGIWSTTRPQVSKETQDLLKGSMIYILFRLYDVQVTKKRLICFQSNDARIQTE